MKTSLLVIILTAHKVSCTIPITGLLACGVISCLRENRKKIQIKFFVNYKLNKDYLGTIAISSISARVSKDCGKCKFISSPSKSAL